MGYLFDNYNNQCLFFLVGKMLLASPPPHEMALVNIALNFLFGGFKMKFGWSFEIDGLQLHYVLYIFLPRSLKN
jgi:hypothetical protein